MRKLLALPLFLWAALAHAQVIGINPTPMGLYYWNTSTSQWTKCPNTSTAEPFQSTPQAFTLEGFNSSLGQWTPLTACPSTSGGGGAGLTSFQGRTNPTAVLLGSDVEGATQPGTNCNISGGYAYTPYNGGCAQPVTTLNAFGFSALTGPVTIQCTGSISCTQSGSTISISQSTPFTINSFTGCGGSFELGQQNVNPICHATYSATPASASITNTDSISSPLVLTTPFTSGTITGTFSHSTVTTTTVTLTAVGSSTQTATQTMTWNPRIFGGVGASGATSTVTASGTTAVLSTSDALPSAGLGTETTGQVIGTYSPSGQCVYVLLIGGSHTFTDAETGFPFAFNAPTAVTFVNQFGVTQSMFLYQSTNILTGTFQPKVAS